MAGAIEKGKARFRTIRPEDAKELTDYYLARTGLIVESSEGRYQFGHLSFQEYLTALYALDRASGAADRAKALEKLLLDRLGKPGWMEVTLLALATDATRTQGTGHRAVLARLEPTKLEHIWFLRRVLSGEEVPLSGEERRAWILAYLLCAGGQHALVKHEHFVDLDSNRPTLEAAWQAVVGALVAGESPAKALRALLRMALQTRTISARSIRWRSHGSGRRRHGGGRRSSVRAFWRCRWMAGQCRTARANGS